jgi:tRNA pseudouridine55 synthase
MSPHGLLVLDKPVGLTSRDAVDRALRWFPRKTRLGHCGTLDPLASGVLVLCVGHATRLTEYVQAMAKTYVADVVLGARSVTDDAEGPITPANVARPTDRTVIDVVLGTFVGTIRQVPPAFSAAKVTGQRAYALARRGETVELAARPVRIDRIDVLEFDYPRLRLEICCGKGTYIRSLARDLGDRIGCGAYLDGLRRMKVGPFMTVDAVSPDADAAAAQARILPMAAAVADMPRVALPTDAVARLGNGQAVRSPDASMVSCEVAVLDPAGALVAIVVPDVAGMLRPCKVFPA